MKKEQTIRNIVELIHFFPLWIIESQLNNPAVNPSFPCCSCSVLFSLRSNDCRSYWGYFQTSCQSIAFYALFPNAQSSAFTRVPLCSCRCLPYPARSNRSGEEASGGLGPGWVHGLWVPPERWNPRATQRAGCSAWHVRWVFVTKTEDFNWFINRI